MNKGKSLWHDALKRIYQDKLAVISLILVVIYSLIALLVSVGGLADNWALEIGASNSAPRLSDGINFIFGTDIFGRSVFQKVLYGTKIAMSVGFVTSLISIPIGVLLGAMAGYFGGKTDDIITWFYTTFASIPNIMLLISITMILGQGILSVYIALGATGWVTLCRLVRAEVMKHRERDYIHAVTSVGGGHTRKLIKHILPNIFHIIIINTSLQFQIAIKSEVILSYLGLGVKGEPSWGTMIDDAKLELARGVWWQLASATFAMFVIVLAFNILGDALRDALDPKLKGKS